MASNMTVPVSSKLAVTAALGFALKQSTDRNYRFEWHQHDCAMLLWVQRGALDSRWLEGEQLDFPGLAAPQTRRLVRHVALLLPAHAAHSTRSDTSRQRHGELYLRPDLLGNRTRWGSFRLDGASLAMLDALSSPALATACAEPLVHVFLAQLAAFEPAQWLDVSAADGITRPLSRRMLHSFARALDQEQPLPAIEAMADELGVSVRQLQRACAAELGASPIAVRRRLIAGRARELLAQGLMPARVAQRLGFTHSGHLNRLLRAVTG